MLREKSFKHYLRICCGLLVILLAVVQCAMAGTVVTPPSRIYNCYAENPRNPQSQACDAAVEVSGVEAFMAWDGVRRKIAGPINKEIPDGRLCSAGLERYKALDLPRDDWKATLLNPDPDNNFEFKFQGSSDNQTGLYKLYLSKDDYDASEPLRWSSLEANPFCEKNTNGGSIVCPLPETKGGRHLVYLLRYNKDKSAATVACVDVILQERDENNQAPVVDINGPYDSVVGKVIDFVSSGSYDKDGRIVSYLWFFGDGFSSTETNPRHSYEFPGEYSVSLTVTDDDGAEDQAFITVKISPAE